MQKIFQTISHGLAAIIFSSLLGLSPLCRADNVVTVWGDDSWGQTNVPVDLTNAVAVASGGQHCLALRRDGTVAAWGRNDFGQCNVPAGLSNVVMVSAGDIFSTALKADGTLVNWVASAAALTSRQRARQPC